METSSKPVAEPEYEVLQIVSTSCSEISSKYKEVLKIPGEKEMVRFVRCGIIPN